MNEPKGTENHLAVFQQKEIRRRIHNNEWWFVITDVIAALTDSMDPQGYLKDMRRRDPEIGKGWGQIATPLSIVTSGGPQKLNCANTEGLFRLIQSIPSPKAEPFKRWLAKVGHERIQEIESPELATRRTRELYKAKGYSDDWIENPTGASTPRWDVLPERRYDQFRGRPGPSNGGIILYRFRDR